jgi:hypothetical protein
MRQQKELAVCYGVGLSSAMNCMLGLQTEGRESSHKKTADFAM